MSTGRNTRQPSQQVLETATNQLRESLMAEQQEALRRHAGLLRLRTQVWNHLGVDECENYEDSEDVDDDGYEHDDEEYFDEDMDGDDCGRGEWSDQFVGNFFETLSVRDHMATENIGYLEGAFGIDLHDDCGWTQNLRDWPAEIRGMLENGELVEESPGDTLETHFGYVEQVRADLQRHRDYFMCECRRGVKSCYMLLCKFVEDLYEMRLNWPADGYSYSPNTELRLLEEEPAR